MNVLEINTNSIKVHTTKCGCFLVAKYEDIRGTYFFNEQLRKEYIPTQKAKKNNKKAKNIFSLNVEYAHKGRERGWDQKDIEVEADTLKEAVEIAKTRFRVIYDISEN